METWSKRGYAMRRKLLVLVAMFGIIAVVTALAGCGTSTPPVSEKPVINEVSPDTGPAGTRITITGEKFGDSQGNGVVHVGSGVAKVSSWADGSIAAVIPDGLDATTQPVTVLTPAGESDYVQYSVVKKQSDQPDPKERQVETINAEQAMVNWLRQNGVDPTGWTFSVTNISEKDPTWKIDKASKTGQADKYFLFHKDAKGNWLIVTTGAAPTAVALPAKGAPTDIYILPPPPPPKQVTQLDAVKNYVQKQGGSPANVYLQIARYSTINPAWAEGSVATNLGGALQNVILHKVNGNWTVVFLGPTPTYQQLIQLGVPKDLAHANTEADSIAAWIQAGNAPPGVTATGWNLKVIKSSKVDSDWEIVSGTQAGYDGTEYWLLHWEGNNWVVKDDAGALDPQQLTAPGMPGDLF